MKLISHIKRFTIAYILIGTFIIISLLGLVTLFSKKSPPQDTLPPKRTRVEAPINTIPSSERPFITLQPLPGRNQLELVVHNLNKPATFAEVILEYDRNKGVLDAVLRQFDLATLPHKENLFLGSRSAGGHITFHEDVIGGDLMLNFDGPQPYSLKVPWRYYDTQSSYDQLSTSDGFFQLSLTSPLRANKVIVMQSPGLPLPIDGQVIAGPYLVRTVGNLPNTNVELAIRLSEATESVNLYGFNNNEWEPIEISVNGRSLSASTVLYDTYVVVSQ